MADLNPSEFQTVVVESFDNGSGIFGNHWGPGTDESVPGQITVHTDPGDVDSGMMVNPSNNGAPEAGWGYGLYNFTLDTSGGIGTYALTWPGTNAWPGPELDLIEHFDDGTPYSTIHYKDASGGNGYQSFPMTNVDSTQEHTYSMDWEPGRITMYVDGQEQWTTTENVPNDAAHGGENTVPSIGAQTWWNDGELNGGNWLTLKEFSYAEHVGSGGDYTPPDQGGVSPPPTGGGEPVPAPDDGGQAPTPGDGGEPAPTPAPDAGGMDGHLLGLINADRAAEGADALSLNDLLDQAANAHTSDMLDQGYFEHNAPDGSTPGDRIESAGYHPQTWGENIAYVSDDGNGQADAAEVEQLHQNLMNSPGHHANLVNADFHDVGLGIEVRDGKVMLTEDFGATNGAGHTPDPTPEPGSGGGTPEPAPGPTPEPTPTPTPDPVPVPDAGGENGGNGGNGHHWGWGNGHHHDHGGHGHGGETPAPEPAPGPAPEPTPGSAPSPEPTPVPGDTPVAQGVIAVVGTEAGETINLPNSVHVFLSAGETEGDTIIGFNSGHDVLDFMGFGKDGKIDSLGGGDFSVHNADGSLADTFHLNGVSTLASTDYVFH